MNRIALELPTRALGQAREQQRRRQRRRCRRRQRRRRRRPRRNRRRSGNGASATALPPKPGAAAAAHGRNATRVRAWHTTGRLGRARPEEHASGTGPQGSMPPGPGATPVPAGRPGRDAWPQRVTRPGWARHRARRASGAPKAAYLRGRARGGRRIRLALCPGLVRTVSWFVVL